MHEVAEQVVSTHLKPNRRPGIFFNTTWRAHAIILILGERVKIVGWWLLILHSVMSSRRESP